MIELQGITKSFSDVQVLRGINATITDGKVVAIVGASGAGKTTLLQIMGSLDKPDSGAVLYDGVDILRLKQKEQAQFRNRELGFVFQFHQLLPEFTAQENVALPAMIAGRSHKEAMSRAAELLDQLGLGERLKHHPAQMSGGERQRTAVARALINDPHVILADEPSGSLDSHNRQELHQMFFSLRERLGITIVIVTHDETLSQMADECLHISDGLILPAEVSTSTADETTTQIIL